MTRMRWCLSSRHLQNRNHNILKVSRSNCMECNKSCYEIEENVRGQLPGLWIARSQRDGHLNRRKKKKEIEVCCIMSSSFMTHKLDVKENMTGHQVMGSSEWSTKAIFFFPRIKWTCDPNSFIIQTNYQLVNLQLVNLVNSWSSLPWKMRQTRVECFIMKEASCTGMALGQHQKIL